MSLLFSTCLMKWRLCIAIAEILSRAKGLSSSKKNRNRRRNRHRMMCRFIT